MTDRDMHTSREERIGDQLAKCTAADFDGHSNFASFSPEQRLEWLARACELLQTMRRRTATPARGDARPPSR
jgi:hypothetical protein